MNTTAIANKKWRTGAENDHLARTETAEERLVRLRRECPWLAPDDSVERAGFLDGKPPVALDENGNPKPRPEMPKVVAWIDGQAPGSYDEADELLIAYRMGGLASDDEPNDGLLLPMSSRFQFFIMSHWKVPVRTGDRFALPMFDPLRERMVLMLADGTRVSARTIGKRCYATGEQVSAALRRGIEEKRALIEEMKRLAPASEALVREEAGARA